MTRQRQAGQKIFIARPGPASGRAFSLIELVAVAAIVGILAATAIPAVASLGGRRGAAAARQIVRDLTYARERAMASGTRTWVVFSASAETYSVLSENVASPGRAGATVINDPASGQAFTITLGLSGSEGVTISSAVFATGQEEVGFDWLGTPLATNGSALTAQGTVTLSTGHQAILTPRTGLAQFVAP